METSDFSTSPTQRDEPIRLNSLPQQSDKPSSLKGFLLETLETVAIALGIFLVIYLFVAQPHLVKGESMLPSYHEGEYILTSKIYKWWGNPQRGDVIVLKSPDDKSVQFIKRIVGLPGEKIKVSSGKVTIYNKEHTSGWELGESYIGTAVPTYGNTFLPDGEVYEIPAGKYFVMGDNRPFSYDSRNWGALPKGDIVGKAFFVYWPLPDFGLVTHASYK
jgi:signal peptidase I